MQRTIREERKNSWQLAAGSWQKAEEQLAGGRRQLAEDSLLSLPSLLSRESVDAMDHSWQVAAGRWQRATTSIGQLSNWATREEWKNSGQRAAGSGQWAVGRRQSI